MDEGKLTARAIAWATLLHVGIAAFLLATTLSCNTWARMVAALHLPDNWNPVTCTLPLAVQGPVIEASLVNTTAAPRPASPKPKTKPSKPAQPEITPPELAQPEVKLPKPAEVKIAPPKPKLPVLKTLPPPPQHPATHTQQKVVEKATAKTQTATHVQQAQQKQHMSELNAQQAQLQKILKQLNAAKTQSEQASKQAELEQKKLAQLNQQPNEQPVSKPTPSPTPLPAATEPQSGTGAAHSSLSDAYIAAITRVLKDNWLGQADIPSGQSCLVHIVQVPGGQIVQSRVTFAQSCQFNDQAKQTVRDAILRTRELPYQGFAKVFRSRVDIIFKPGPSGGQ